MLRGILVFALLTSVAVQADKISEWLSRSAVLNGFDLKNQLPQMRALYDKGHNCTATLIGPRVILTAAHCMREGLLFGNPDFPIGIPVIEYEVHPQYKFKAFNGYNIPYDLAIPHDVALGILMGEEKDPITVTDQVPKINDVVVFVGRSNNLRKFGYSKVVMESPLGLTIRGFGSKPQATARGDSGGPNFVVGPNGEVRIFAVNSTSTRDEDMSSDWDIMIPYTQGIARVIPALGAEDAPFLKSFTERHGVEICGINKDCAPIYFKIKADKKVSP